MPEKIGKFNPEIVEEKSSEPGEEQESLEIKKEKKMAREWLEGKGMAEKIGAIRREIADRLLAIKINISVVKEVFENKSKKKAQDYFDKCSLDLQEIKGIDIWLEELELVIKEAKNFNVLKNFQKKLNEIKENLKGDNFNSIVESFIKKDLNKLLEADKSDYFGKFENEVDSSLSEMEEYFKEM